VLFYEMVTGRLPFDGQNSAELLLRIGQAKYRAPAVGRDALPHTVDAILGRCLQKEPTRRYPTAQALLTAVQHAAQEVSRPPRVPPAYGPLTRCGKAILLVLRDNWPLTLAAVALVLMLTLGVYVTASPPPEQKGGEIPNISHQPEMAYHNCTPLPHGKKSPGSQPAVRIDVTGGPAQVYCAGENAAMGHTPFAFTGKPGDRITFTLKRDGYDNLQQAIDIPETDHLFVFQLEKAAKK
jgi:hypothetical protein